MLKKHEISGKLISNINSSELVNDQVLITKKSTKTGEFKEIQNSDKSINGTELFSLFTANVIQCDEIFVR